MCVGAGTLVMTKLRWFVPLLRFYSRLSAKVLMMIRPKPLSGRRLASSVAASVGRLRGLGNGHTFVKDVKQPRSNQIVGHDIDRAAICVIVRAR